jgi:LmbE family N-acetylglucosaminyl deacetylase
MKPTPTSPIEIAPLLAIGAHPDDIEFGCGGVIARETRAGRAAHFVVCSRGEAASNGTPAQRTAEAEKSAALLGATLEFVELEGDAHLEARVTHAIKLAGIIRRLRPGIVLALSVVENQHPDHPRIGQLARNAARLARYAGLAELRDWPPHTINQLFFYAVTPVLIDISAPEIVAVWTAAMAVHASQARTRNYAELQLTRARLRGLSAGIGHAIALYPNDPLVLDSLARLSPGASRF